MVRYYTSIEQSKHLLELGIDTNTADMYYTKIYNTFTCKDEYEVIVSPKNKSDDIPCWSVGALIDLMPEQIRTCEPWDPDESKRFLLKMGKGWIIYECLDLGFDPLVYFNGDKTGIISTIDACYDMVIWLLEKGYIKKN